ncbi:hypothetical protein ACPP3B_03665 [Tepidimonas sp. HKU77]|uniref:hypothetical protein n=1 Tax=Tepidimonas sp. HKU77 TaxID=3414503 RepID=UPI003C7A691E
MVGPSHKNPDTLVKEALGHTQLKTTMKYLHLTDKTRKQTEEVLAQRLLQGV